MSVREHLRLHKVWMAGVVALTLTGAGTAIAWSATDSLSPTSTPAAAAPGKSDQAPGQEKPAKSQRPQHLHSESVVKKADGTFETQLTQQGTVDSVSGTSITVRSEDGFTQSYAVNADTKITKFPAPAADGSPARGADGKRLKPAEVAIGEIAAGESVRVSGVRSGTDVVARQIVEGAPTGPGKGSGLGQGHGKGHGLGLPKGHGHDKQLSPK